MPTLCSTLLVTHCAPILALVSDSAALVTVLTVLPVVLGMQEQYDQLQRQMQQAIAREGELRTGLDTDKTEHMELLTANAQLVEKCQSLSKKVQVGASGATRPVCSTAGS